MSNLVQRFWNDESGQGLVEYVQLLVDVGLLEEVEQHVISAALTEPGSHQAQCDGSGREDERDGEVPASRSPPLARARRRRRK